jgi:hypothetical protein
MTGLVDILQTVLIAAADQPEQKSQSAQLLDMMWEHVQTLDVIEALTFIAFGTVWLVYGWRIFKILVTICFGLLGLFLGTWANQQLIGGNAFWLGLICVIFFSVLSIPFMRWGVSVLGALSGGILTSGAWVAFGLPQQYIWAGGLVGLVAGGMISFIVFKIAVILFTSLGGSALLAVGALAVAYQHLPPEQDLEGLISANTWILGAMVLVPMALGVVLQNKLIKGAPDWNT